MLKRIFLVFLFSISSLIGFSNNIVKNDTILKPAQIIDSILLSEKLDWSVRLLANFKQQRLTLSNDNGKLYYKPNNPYGVGLGIANQKIVIDILFNIKSEKEDYLTKKFAAEGGIVLKNNYFGFVLENVHGYNITNDYNDDEVFRKDLSIFTLGLDYMHLFNEEHFSVRMMKSGLTDEKKALVSFGVGGFFITTHLTADGSIIPENSFQYFDYNSGLSGMRTYGVGILGGIAAYFTLPGNLFLSVSAIPGIGLEYKEISSEIQSYNPSDPFVYKFDTFGTLGYKGKNFYVHLNFRSNLYSTDLDFDNNALLGITKSKLIFGYNIGKINFNFKKKKAHKK